jgi:hypothetical protein
LYTKKVRPAEEAFAFGAFADSPPLEAADFGAKPLVLLLGQYSCGKTTFITHLLGRSFPLAVIGAIRADARMRRNRIACADAAAFAPQGRSPRRTGSAWCTTGTTSAARPGTRWQRSARCPSAGCRASAALS